MVLYIVDMGFLLAVRLFNLPVSERVVSPPLPHFPLKRRDNATSLYSCGFPAVFRTPQTLL